jgi:hypothetical protein
MQGDARRLVDHEQVLSSYRTFSGYAIGTM